MAPRLSRVCGLGFCASTSPLLTLLEKACVILPTLQCAALIARPAAPSFLPVTLGTTQVFVGGGGGGPDLVLNVAVTFSASLIVTSQVLVVPEHAPDQLENIDPAAVVALNGTTVPA